MRGSLPTAVRKLWRLLDRRQRQRFCLLPLPMFVGAMLEAVSVGVIPLFIAFMIDRQQVADLPVVGPWMAALPPWAPEDILIIGGSGLMALFLVRGLFLVGLQHIVSGFTTGCARDIGGRLFNLYMTAPYTYHLGRNSAELVRNVIIETQRCALQVITAILQIMLTTLMFIGICVPMVIADPPLAAAVIVVGGGISMAVLRAMRGRASRYGRQLTEQNGQLLRATQEGFGAFKDFWLRGSVPFVVARVQRFMGRRAKALYVQQFLVQAVKPILETVGVIGLFLVPIVLVARGAALVDVVPIMTLLVVVAARLLPTISTMTQSMVRLRTNAYTLDVLHGEIEDLEARRATATAERGPVESGSLSFTHDIALEDVAYVYPGVDEAAVRGLSLTIPKGHSVAFVGPTGAGKTTAVDLIIGILQPTSGRVTVDGKDIALHQRDWLDHIGYIPQTIFLLDDTIQRNVALGLPDREVDVEAVNRALALAQLDDFVAGLPEGLETRVGERGVRLSGGQRQRLGIARALYHNPSVLILDEATSAVDNVTERKLMAALESARAGRTFIMVAHRLSTVRNCDTIYFMKEGRLVASGDFESLQRENAEFNALAI